MDSLLFLGTLVAVAWAIIWTVMNGAHPEGEGGRKGKVALSTPAGGGSLEFPREIPPPHIAARYKGPKTRRD